MSKEADDVVLAALQQHHGTIILNNPSKALVAVGKENSELHEEMDRCHRELDIYREALTVIAYLNPRMLASPITGQGATLAFDKCQHLAKAALSQLVLGADDRTLLQLAQQAQRDTNAKRGN
jgi:hypothetical protein